MFSDKWMAAIAEKLADRITEQLMGPHKRSVVLEEGADFHKSIARQALTDMIATIIEDTLRKET